jgi:hypothetical protein
VSPLPPPSATVAASWRSAVGRGGDPLYQLVSRRWGGEVGGAPWHLSCLGRAAVAS